MPTIEKEIFLLKTVGEYGYETICTTDLSDGQFSGDYIRLGKGVATIELEEADERELLAGALKKRRTKMVADHVVAVEKIDEQIEQLLAIGHDGEAL